MSFLNIYCRVVLVCSGILSFSASVFAGDLTIIPGKSIGKTYLGESRVQVLRNLGQPSEIEPSEDGMITSISGLRMDTWRGKDLGPAVFVSYRAGRVVQITTNNPRFRTANGISVSSTVNQIRRRFKHSRRYTYHDGANSIRTHTRLYDPVAGIAFVNTNDASISDVVTVYRPGHPVIEDVE